MAGRLRRLRNQGWKVAIIKDKLNLISCTAATKSTEGYSFIGKNVTTKYMEWINRILCNIGIHKHAKPVLWDKYYIRRSCKNCGLIQQLQGKSPITNPTCTWVNVGYNIFSSPPKQKDNE